MNTTIVWLESDLRLEDNEALMAASDAGRCVPVYLHVPNEKAPWQNGPASCWWLGKSLISLNEHLQRLNSRLIVRSGTSSFDLLAALIHETGATAAYFNRRTEPHLVSRDEHVTQKLNESGITTRVFETNLIAPGRLVTGGGTPFKVFTPFWNAFRESVTVEKPLPGPESLLPPRIWPESSEPSSLFENAPPFSDATYHEFWKPGIDGAQQSLEALAAGGIDGYQVDRDYPSVSGTSRLSPYLRHGELSPRQIWAAIEGYGPTEDREAFRRQLVWREFAYDILHHNPESSEQPLKREFAHFAWTEDADLLDCWERGETGYPIVDAGIRELRQTGWMHNRVRMIVASFLTKHLGIDWRRGAAFFWDRLVDADLANNTMGWQWVAGCGADASPYFRIFNPVLQGSKFDKDGSYIRKWIPELAKLPAKHIHSPWFAPLQILRNADVALGDTYPSPIVDHKAARGLALDKYQEMKEITRRRGNVSH